MIGANMYTKSLEEYQALFKKANPGQLCGDISPDYLYYYQNAVPKILEEKNAQIPIIIVLRNPIDRAYSHYLNHVRNRMEKLSFEDALNAEEERRAANWSWGWFYIAGGLYAEQVKAYMDNFERILVLLFEEDIVTGQATNKILNFLNIESFPQSLTNVHANRSGYPKNRLLHRMTMRVLMDELIVRKVKNVIKMTSLYPGAKRIYRKIREINLKKVDMAPQTRQVLKEKVSGRCRTAGGVHRPPRSEILDGFSVGLIFSLKKLNYCYLPLYIFCGEHLLSVRLHTVEKDSAVGTVD